MTITRQLVRNFGTCLSFDGSTSYVDSTDLGLNIATSATISVWAKVPTDFKSRSQGLFDTAPGSSGAMRIYADGSGNIDCSVGGATVQNVALSTLSRLYGEWSHWCFVFTTPTAFILYYNGVVIKSGTSSQRILSNVFRVGRTNSLFFGGLLDEAIAHVNYAWTATDVNNYLYRGVVPSSPFTYHKFDEGSGTSATDSSGNVHTGTITGATYSTDVVMKLRTAVS